MSAAADDDDSFGVPALDDWYDKALKHGLGFQSDEERRAYVASLGDPLLHPMFATSAESLAQHPLSEAFRCLREEDKSPLELCLMYKDEGNEWLKRGKDDKKSCRESINLYLHALSFLTKEEQQPQVQEVEEEERQQQLISQLHSNIALANLHLGNFGSCMRAAELSLRYWPGNCKAHYRRAKALSSLHRHAEAAEACRSGLEQFSAEVTLTALLQSSEAALARAARERSARAAAFGAQEQAWRDCWQLCRNAGARLGYFNPAVAQPAQLGGRTMPFLSSSSSSSEAEGGGIDACWPCVLSYPEYGQFDAIERVSAADFLVEQLAVVFPDLRNDGAAPVAWDARRDYQYHQLVVYLLLQSSSSPPASTTETPAVAAAAGLVPQDCEAWLQFCRDAWTVQHGAPPPEGPAEGGGVLGELVLEERVASARRRVEDTLAQMAAAPLGRHVEVGLGCTFAQLLAVPGHCLAGGLLQLKVFVRGSEAQRRFLKAEASARGNAAVEVVGPSLEQVQGRL